MDRLSKHKLKKTRVIIASALFAIVLWVTVNMGSEYTTMVQAQVVVQNLPSDVAISRALPDRLRVRVRGEGWKLFGLYLTGDMRYTIDMQNARETMQVRTMQELDERLRLPGGIEVLEISPSLLPVSIEEQARKAVPVVADLQVQFRDGFNIIGPVTVQPDSVTVRGARSVIENLDGWKTKPIVLRDIRNPVRTTVELSDSLRRLVHLDQSSAAVAFDVQPIAEKTLSGIRIAAAGVPSNREVVFIPPRIDLVVRGGINRLALVRPEQYTATVHYRDILADTTGSVTPVIEGPKDVRIVIREPERFQYIIRRLQ